MHFRKLKPFVVILPAICLFGCSDSVSRLREISPVAGDFSSSLAAEYLAYAESEQEQGKGCLAEHFAYKGVKAFAKEDISPDEVNIKSDDFEDLASSRAAFMDILSEDLKRVVPQKVARAQILFDCWNEQDSSQLSDSDISCAEEFRQVYDELREVADNLAHGADSRSVVEFYEGSAELDAEAKYVIAKVAAHFSGHDDYVLELDAHYVGKNKKDIYGRLTQKRLSVIREALISAGVRKDRIFTVKPDGVRASGGAVYLSSDDIVYNRDKIDITVTSIKHLLVKTL